MQGIKVSHKRRSIQKIIPQMPIKKLSANSRQQSSRRHRTRYKGIQSPQSQLKDYKHKNFKILNQLQASANTKYAKRTLITQHTLQSSLPQPQDSTTKKIQAANSSQAARYTPSVHSFQSDRGLPHDQTVHKPQYQVTSRFSQNHHDPDSSLAFLISQNKSNNSNPLINTARLKQQQFGAKIQSDLNRVEVATVIKKLAQENSCTDTYIPASKNIIQGGIGQSLRQLAQYRNSQNYTQENDMIRASYSVDNFDDYQFGGNNSQSMQEQTSVALSKNGKAKPAHMMPAPTTQAYSHIKARIKPYNWRQMNRYIPQTQQQHRMSTLSYLNQKLSIQATRQQQQLTKLIQQYQLHKNNLTNASKRKTQTNKIIQHIYKDKKSQHEIKRQISLPQLRRVQAAKVEILIPGVKQLCPDQQKCKVGCKVASGMQTEGKQVGRDVMKHSLSYNRMGFGSRRPRNLNQQDERESQIQTVQKVQRKLREKGVQFNSDSIRRGLLNFKDAPLCKISKNVYAHVREEDNMQSCMKMQTFPEKQLPSNGFYKIFPL